MEVYKQLSLGIFDRYFAVTNSVNNKYINREFCNKGDSFVFEANTMIIFSVLTGKIFNYYNCTGLKDAFWDDYKYFMRRDFSNSIFRKNKMLERILHITYLINRYFSELESRENWKIEIWGLFLEIIEAKKNNLISPLMPKLYLLECIKIDKKLIDMPFLKIYDEGIIDDILEQINVTESLL